MIKRIHKHITLIWNENPLVLILTIAIVLRLVSVIFSKGYEMHDDHFLIIEAPQSWVDGRDYNNWLPWNQSNPEPTGHSFFYIGFHFLFFYALKIFGITNPQIKMLLVRLIHALFSLLIVSLGYRITEKLSDRKSAKIVGLLLASYWFMPFFSVRNLVEIVCIPFLMLGLWMILNADTRRHLLRWIFFAGFVSGMAFSVRYQTSVFLAGIGLALLLKKQIWQAVAFGFGVMLSVIVFQGIIDFIIWGYPFAEFLAYSAYNVRHQYDFITGGWYNYLGVICGMLIPPFSLLLFWGFLRTWKKHLLVFLPTIIFLVLHSLYPNKQERFIFPIIPFIILLGVIGWNEFYEKSKFWHKQKLIYSIILILFWVINTAGLVLFTASYAKKARVETMSYLSSYKNINFILIDDSNRSSATMLPRYYLNQWPSFYVYPKPVQENYNCTEISKPGEQFFKVDNLECLNRIRTDSLPDFVIFIDEVNLKDRLAKISEYIPNLEFIKRIDPGFRDKVMHSINKVNYNVPIYIYKTPYYK